MPEQAEQPGQAAPCPTGLNGKRRELPDIPQRNGFYFSMRAILVALKKIFFRLETIGAENLPKEGGVLVVPNHASNLDPTTIACLMPREVHFLAKEELFTGLLGKFLRKVNAHPLKRSGIDRGAILMCNKILRSGHVLMLFPEGERTWDGELLPAKPGAALIATQTSVPLVPAYIWGSFEAMPRGAKWIKPRKIRVFVGKPFHLEPIDAVRLPRKEYYEYAGRIMMEKIKELETQAREYAARK